MKRMAVGFAFDANKELVVLAKKNRPDWQAGKLNGPGGHIEGDETPAQAMSREFWEETGVEVEPDYWSLFASLKAADGSWIVYCLSTVMARAELKKVRSTTDEDIHTYLIGALGGRPRVPNLDWLIPLALDATMGKIHFAAITYREQ